MKKTIRSIIAFLMFLTSLGAFAQSDSRYDAGLNLPFNQKAGDVNPQTGNLSLGVTDLILPGRAGMDFSFSRLWSLNQSNAYNMSMEEGGGNYLTEDTNDKFNHLGIGWNASLPFIFQYENAPVVEKNLFFGGNVYELDTGNLDDHTSTESHIKGYDLLDLRVYTTDGDTNIAYSDFGYDSEDNLNGNYVFTDLPAEVDDTSDTTSEYVLILKDDSRYYFNTYGKLMMQQDRTGKNRIWYFYHGTGEDARLCLVVDTAERFITFDYDGNGNLASISWKVQTGLKTGSATRSYAEVDRQILYHYINVEDTPKYQAVADLIPGDQPTYLLSGITDVAGNRTTYDYEMGFAQYSFMADKAEDTNAYLMLTTITTMDDQEGGYLNQRHFEYELTNERKVFYNGFMEFYKIARQYMVDKNGRITGDTNYTYFGRLDDYPLNEYSTEITVGDVTTTYSYTISSLPAKNQVLDRVLTESHDGYVQLTDYLYNNDRAIEQIDVDKQGKRAYTDIYDYDKKGNMTGHIDRSGLKTQIVYDDQYSIPIEETRKLTVDGVSVEYRTSQTINNYGQVTEQYFYEVGKTAGVLAAMMEYDAYGNVITQTDAGGNMTHIEYDANHLFPVKTWQNLTIKDWSDSGSHNFWVSPPDLESVVTDIRTWKVFNSEGTVWMELDNEGYAVEHYYDAYGREIETIMPNGNDNTGIITGNPTDLWAAFFSDETKRNNYFALRADNPGSRVYIEDRNDFIFTVADVDAAFGTLKVSSAQKDGLGNSLEETEYKVLAGFDEGNYDPETGFAASFLAARGGTGLEIYGVKSMTYDTLGRMIALTDPDHGDTPKGTQTIHGTTFDEYDKTWMMVYDDMGRQEKVYYPMTMPGRTHTKTISYDDLRNWVTTTDPEGRRVIEKKDWNDNLVELVHQGDSSTPAEEYQVYQYEYDKLNRKIKFTDPRGTETTYHYNERDLLVEQGFGVSGSDIMVYNDLGHLIKKTDRNGHVIGFVYDEMGRNTKVHHYENEQAYADDPADISGIKSGTNVQYTVETIYDFRGNPVRVDNQNLIEHYTYDYANRVTSLERYVKVADINSKVTNQLGGIFDSSLFNDSIFTFSYAYNDAGMVTKMTNPDGTDTEYSYSEDLSLLSGIVADSETFVSELDYNKSGVVTRMLWGNGTEQSWSFDNRKRISHITIADPNDSLNPHADLFYTLNGSGDILFINRNEYRYDGFDRIVYASTLLPGQKDYRELVRRSFSTISGMDPYEFMGELRAYNEEADLNGDGFVDGWDHAEANFIASESVFDEESFDYDRNGNRTSLIQNHDEYIYHYGERNRLESIERKREGETDAQLYVEYSYDNNGNTTSRTIYRSNAEIEYIRFEYDGMNRLVNTSKEIYPGGFEAEPTSFTTTTYYYDNAGNRFIKQDEEGTTLYLRHGQIAVAMDLEMPTDTSTEQGKVNRYILSGDLLAGRVTVTVDTSGTVLAAENFYYHLDHLNSTKAVTDRDGHLVVIYEYRAFGEQLKRLDDAGDETGDEAKYSYGGKELDGGTNLYYFNARYYDATIGRFINVDPVQDGTNWYVYCGNNPLIMVDPTGLLDGLYTFADQYRRALFSSEVLESGKLGGAIINMMGNDIIPKPMEWFHTVFSFVLSCVPGNLAPKLDNIVSAVGSTDSFFSSTGGIQDLVERKQQGEAFRLLGLALQNYSGEENYKIYFSAEQISQYTINSDNTFSRHPIDVSYAYLSFYNISNDEFFTVQFAKFYDGNPLSFLNDLAENEILGRLQVGTKSTISFDTWDIYSGENAGISASGEIIKRDMSKVNRFDLVEENIKSNY